MSKRSKSLGKGLGALLPDKPLYESQKETSDEIRLIDIDLVYPNKEQPRSGFNKEKLMELSESIKQNGIIQPIVVTAKGEGYMIIAGERRYRAAKMASFSEIPAIVRDIPEEKILEFALIENIQREDLLPIEEARALDSLIEKLDISKTELAKRIGKSRSHVSNMIRLLELPTYIQTLLENDVLSMGHARPLLSLEDVNMIEQVADDIVKRELNVRQVERLVKNLSEKKEEGPNRKKHVVNLIIKELEESLQSDLKTKVEIKSRGKKGKIIIEYYSNEDLERLIAEIKGDNR